MIQDSIIPQIVALKRCELLSPHLRFDIFPKKADGTTDLALDFSDVTSMDRLVDQFVTKPVQLLPFLITFLIP